MWQATYPPSGDRHNLKSVVLSYVYFFILICINVLVFILHAIDSQLTSIILKRGAEEIMISVEDY